MFAKKLLNAFTLVELLIVIAVMGVLAGAVLVSINPQDKLNLANDSKVQADVSQVATAVASYYTQNAYYPKQMTDLTTAELAIAPIPPTGYGAAYGFVSLPSTCTVAAKDCVSTIIYGSLKAVKWGTQPVYQKWTSVTGKVCQAGTTTGDCP